MATARPFAYNPGSSIPGTEQVGSLSIGYPTSGFTANPQYWNGPDEELGYVIAIPVSAQTQPTPLTVTWDPNYIGTGNLLSEKNTVVTNNAANSSVLSTRLIAPNEKVMFSVKINQMIYGYIGFGQQDMDINSNLGSNDGKSVALGPDGNYYFSGTVQNSGLPSWGNVNDIIDVALNTNTNSIWFRVNGGNWNGDLNENPELGSTLSVPISNLYGGLTPFPVNIQGKATILGQSIYSIPTGYKFLGETLASVGFYRSSSLTESSFVLLTNRVFFQNFTSGNEAKTWLNDNGYWTSFVPLATPTPTVTNTPTVTPTNTNTPTNTSTSTQTPTPSVTNTQTPTTTTTLTATQTPSATPTSTTTQTPTVTPTNTRTPTQTPTVSPTTTRTPTPTPTPGLLKVLFLGDGSVTSYASLINTYITATGQSISYSAVTMSTNYTGSGNITKANYDVVMIYTNSGQIGTTTMANALTTFVGQGGSIVSGTFLWNLYPVGYNFTGTTTFNINNQSNPVGGNIIITSATTITNGIGLTMPTTFNNGAITLNSGSAQLATYSDGTNLLAVKTIGSATLVGINAFPGNINSSTSTITKMFGNAILYAGGKLSPAPTTTPTPTTTQTPTNTPNLQGFSYSNFTSTGGTVSVGNVSLSSNILYLTTATGGQVGNVYRTTAIQYNRNFSTTWSTFIGGGTGADGYCVQWTPTNNTNGPTGGGVGLLNTAINAITFLTFTANNYTWYKNGVSQGATSVTSGFWRQTLYFWGDYNHSAQTFALYYSTTNIKPGSPNQTFNSFSFDTGSYYMGFGAGTGGSTDNHELRSWSLQFT